MVLRSEKRRMTNFSYFCSKKLIRLFLKENIDPPIPTINESVSSKTHQLDNSKLLNFHKRLSIFIKVNEVSASVPTWTFKMPLKACISAPKISFLD